MGMDGLKATLHFIALKLQVTIGQRIDQKAYLMAIIVLDDECCPSASKF